MSAWTEKSKRGAAIAAAFGAALRDLRQPRYSQEKLAELAGIDSTYVSLLERGLRQPTVGVFLNLATALRVEPAQLIVPVIAEINRLGISLATGDTLVVHANLRRRSYVGVSSELPEDRNQSGAAVVPCPEQAVDK